MSAAVASLTMKEVYDQTLVVRKDCLLHVSVISILRNNKSRTRVRLTVDAINISNKIRVITKARPSRKKKAEHFSNYECFSFLAMSK